MDELATEILAELIAELDLKNDRDINMLKVKVDRAIDEYADDCIDDRHNVTSHESTQAWGHKAAIASLAMYDFVHVGGEFQTSTIEDGVQRKWPHRHTLKTWLRKAYII